MSTDGLTDKTKLIVTFRNFADVPRKGMDAPLKLFLDELVAIMLEIEKDLCTKITRNFKISL